MSVSDPASEPRSLEEGKLCSEPAKLRTWKRGWGKWGGCLSPGERNPPRPRALHQIDSFSIAFDLQNNPAKYYYSHFALEPFQGSERESDSPEATKQEEPALRIGCLTPNSRFLPNLCTAGAQGRAGDAQAPRCAHDPHPLPSSLKLAAS